MSASPPRSSISWMRYGAASRRKELPAENGGSQHRDVGVIIAPRRKLDDLARELRRRVSIIGQSGWLDSDDSSGAARRACAIAGMERSRGRAIRRVILLPTRRGPQRATSRPPGDFTLVGQPHDTASRSKGGSFENGTVWRLWAARWNPRLSIVRNRIAG